MRQAIARSQCLRSGTFVKWTLEILFTFFSSLTSSYLLQIGVKDYCYTWSHAMTPLPTHTHTQRYIRYYLGTWCIQHYYRWCAHHGWPVVDWTDAPADLNGLVRLAERRNVVSARVPSHFKRSVHAMGHQINFWSLFPAARKPSTATWNFHFYFGVKCMFCLQ